MMADPSSPSPRSTRSPPPATSWSSRASPYRVASGQACREPDTTRHEPRRQYRSPRPALPRPPDCIIRTGQRFTCSRPVPCAAQPGQPASTAHPPAG